MNHPSQRPSEMDMLRSILRACIDQERRRQDAGDHYAAVRWGVYAQILDLVESKPGTERRHAATQDLLPLGRSVHGHDA